MSVCRRVISPAELGQYELHVSAAGPNVVLNGIHSVDGVEVDSWTHSELVREGPHAITVAKRERHRILVFASFKSADKAEVELVRDGQTLRKCDLERDGKTSSSMSVLAPK